jgi:hypothetical protein
MTLRIGATQRMRHVRHGKTQAISPRSVVASPPASTVRHGCDVAGGPCDTARSRPGPERAIGRTSTSSSWAVWVWSRGYKPQERNNTQPAGRRAELPARRGLAAAFHGAARHGAPDKWYRIPAARPIVPFLRRTDAAPPHPKPAVHAGANGPLARLAGETDGQVGADRILRRRA